MMARILLVDDDLFVRKPLKEMLLLGGHEVVEAEDGDKALRALEGGAFELVITDIFMPEKDGLSLIMDLRAKHPGLAVIAISGGSPMIPIDMLPTAKRFGALRTLAKPILPDDLLKAVAEVLG
jgi:two-component system, chemotaxis family, chemotaxis protein CheY